MQTAGNLYELAMAMPATADGLLHLGPCQTLFVGALGHIGAHCYGAPVFLAGLYGTFRLRIGAGNWTMCRTALIPAGVRHELDGHGEALGIVCWEPEAAAIPVLTKLLRNRAAHGQGLVGMAGEVGVLRALYEDGAGPDWAEQALADLVGGGRRRAGNTAIDPRIAGALAGLRACPHDMASAAAIAGRHGLSASRFLHLFSAQTGVSYRRYRAWCRARAALGAVIAGSNLTDAALAAGFSDSAHFSHQFRALFGVPPSCLLQRVARAGVVLAPMESAAPASGFRRGRFAEKNHTG